MTDEPQQAPTAEDAVTRLAGPDPSNTEPVKITDSLDPADDVYTLIDPAAPADTPPAETPAPEDGSTGDQS